MIGRSGIGRIGVLNALGPAGNAAVSTELVGLGCPLEEWDAIVATMPESVRPEDRGSWTPAFERYAIKFRAQQRAKVRASAPPSNARQLSASDRASAIVSTLRTSSALTVMEIARRLGEPDYLVYRTLVALMEAGSVTRTSVVENRCRTNRYTIAAGGDA